MFASYLAAKLPRLHFGFSVQTIPLHHPVRFAERLNLLDQLTDGKILVGIGSGTTPEEMIGLGVNFKDTKTLTDSNMAIVEQLWAKQPEDEPIVFDNGQYKGAVVSRIAPVAFSPRGPRVMSVAMRPASVQRAATMGQPAFIPAFTPPVLNDGDPLPHLRRYFAAYKEALEAAGHPQEVVDAALDWSTHTYQHVHVAESDAQAEDEFHQIIDLYQAAIEREHEANKAAEAITGVDLGPAHDGRNEGWQKTWCLWGSPATVTEHLAEIRDIGIGNTLGAYLGGTVTPQRVAWGKKAMELMASDVMPKFASR
jgi:alkanesulfonate monooxygenase SsuD/methylene tetrahydromethanopterin reductase-like flavin-dependent oxidoreductase (luciferase family)